MFSTGLILVSTHSCFNTNAGFSLVLYLSTIPIVFGSEAVSGPSTLAARGCYTEGVCSHWILSAAVFYLLLFRSSRFCACNTLVVNMKHTERQEDTLILSCLLGWRIFRINPIMKARCFQRGEGIHTFQMFSWPTCTSKATVANGACTPISAYILWLNMFARKLYTSDLQDDISHRWRFLCCLFGLFYFV